MSQKTSIFLKLLKFVKIMIAKKANNLNPLPLQRDVIFSLFKTPAFLIFAYPLVKHFVNHPHVSTQAPYWGSSPAHVPNTCGDLVLRLH